MMTSSEAFKTFPKCISSPTKRLKELPIKLLTALISRKKVLLISQINIWRDRITCHWHKLKSFQQLYLLAALSTFIYSPLAVFIALWALALDFWPRLEKLWESLAGKALILLFYAGATNFAMTSSAGLVNEITGLDAGYFPYAHYTAILLSLPLWIFGTSLVALALLQVFFPLFFLSMFCLRLIGIRSAHLFKSLHYPIITMLLRFSLSLFLLIKAGEFFDDNDTESENIIEKTIAEQLQEIPEYQIGLTGQETEGSKPRTKTDTSESAGDVNISFFNEGYMANVRQLVKQFIFHFEANNYSRCELSKNARSIELNNFQHVEITQDESQPEGYRFEVKACISPGIPITSND